MKNKQSLWIILIVFLALIVAGAIYYIFLQKGQMKDLLQQSEIVKEELADEYNETVIEFEGLKLRIRNDTLIAKLETEQQKVKKLQEELRTVKATNTKRINELKKELETLRAILQDLYKQLEALNKKNEELTKENRQVKAQYNQAAQTVSQLTKEKEQLAETVQQAAKLSTSNITVTGLNDKNKPTDEIKKLAKIEFRFTINRNITATPGEKTIYIRIMKPDDDVLIKSLGDVFTYEDKEINFSAKRNIEYEGEEYPMSIYWDLQEYLPPGTCRVDIFADGNRIGQKSFKFK